MRSSKRNYLSVSFLTFILGCCILSACDDNLVEKSEPDDTLVGISLVDLNADKAHLRSQEALLGNLVADSMLYYATLNQLEVDFALTNSGSIRFSSQNRPDGIYPAGNLSEDDIKEILPFGGKLVVVSLSGAELRQVLERSVSSLPLPEGDSGSGAFLQVSSYFEMDADLQNPAQITDTEAEIIVSQGSRISYIKIRGEAFDLNRQYQVILGAYIAGGGDSFYTLANIPAERKTLIEVEADEVLRQYIQANSPVAPMIEGRINIYP